MSCTFTIGAQQIKPVPQKGKPVSYFQAAKEWFGEKGEAVFRINKLVANSCKLGNMLRVRRGLTPSGSIGELGANAGFIANSTLAFRSIAVLEDAIKQAKEWGARVPNIPGAFARRVEKTIQVFSELAFTYLIYASWLIPVVSKKSHLMGRVSIAAGFFDGISTSVSTWMAAKDLRKTMQAISSLKKEAGEGAPDRLALNVLKQTRNRQLILIGKYGCSMTSVAVAVAAAFAGVTLLSQLALVTIGVAGTGFAIASSVRSSYESGLNYKSINWFDPKQVTSQV